MQPADSSTSTIEPRRVGSTRRSASVARSARDARTASPIASRLRKPPVPITSRERNSRPAMTSASATLHRLHHLYARAVGERHDAPAAARHHLAVERNRHAAALLGRAGGEHRVAHAGRLLELVLLAVQHDPHATPAGTSISATASAATGASSTPLR